VTSLAVDPRVAWQTVDGQAVVMDLAEGRVLGLNPLGSFVWTLLSRGADVAAITGAVTERFDVEPARAREDVLAFLGQLRERRLIAERP